MWWPLFFFISSANNKIDSIFFSQFEHKKTSRILFRFMFVRRSNNTFFVKKISPLYWALHRIACFVFFLSSSHLLFLPAKSKLILRSRCWMSTSPKSYSILIPIVVFRSSEFEACTRLMAVLDQMRATSMALFQSTRNRPFAIWNIKPKKKSRKKRSSSRVFNDIIGPKCFECFGEQR